MIEYKKSIHSGRDLKNIYYISDKYYINNYDYELYNSYYSMIYRRDNFKHQFIGIKLNFRYK